MTITALPTPVPSRNDPVNFSVRADAFLGALPTFATEANALATEVNTYKNNAETAATTATTQAGISTTKAEESSNSAADALVYKNAAEAAKDEAVLLNEKYLGAASSDPTTDKTGGTLSAGDWYVNTASGFVRVYNGVVWVQGISAIAGVSSINTQQGDISLKTIRGESLIGSGNIPSVLEDYQEFTSSGTWTKPTYATWVYVECIGGGGGGGASLGGSGSSGQSSGGGGGGWAGKLFRASDITTTVSVVVGAGGVAGVKNSASAPSAAGDGGDSTFGSYLKGKGGIGGKNGTEAGTSSSGGSDSLRNFPYVLSSYASGSGGGTADGGGSVQGGAGGAGCTGGGVTGVGGTSDYAGNGGDSVFTNVGNVTISAGVGESPGGGGGSATSLVAWVSGSWSGGAGGSGRIRVWCW